MRQETIVGPDTGLLPTLRMGEAKTHGGSNARLRPPLPAPREAPERYRALSSADPARQLRDALKQVDVLLRQNIQLSERVAALRRSLATAAHLALHDELTGLANRRLLLDRFQNAIAQRPSPHGNVALVFLDLDGFKGINDRLGHAAGDHLLQLLAGRLVDGIRAGDTACRFGGDEFVVLLTGVVGREGAARAMAHIRACLLGHYLVDGCAIDVRASMGLAVYPFDGVDFDALVRVSDHAMARSKPCGDRDCFGRSDEAPRSTAPDSGV
jgi:diguanylate cyclase